jgi:hypothetical protein
MAYLTLEETLELTGGDVSVLANMSFAVFTRIDDGEIELEFLEMNSGAWTSMSQATLIHYDAQDGFALPSGGLWLSAAHFVH